MGRRFVRGDTTYVPGPWRKLGFLLFLITAEKGGGIWRCLGLGGVGLGMVKTLQQHMPYLCTGKARRFIQVGGWGLGLGTGSERAWAWHRQGMMSMGMSVQRH